MFISFLVAFNDDDLGNVEAWRDGCKVHSNMHTTACLSNLLQDLYANGVTDLFDSENYSVHIWLGVVHEEQWADTYDLFRTIQFKEPNSVLYIKIPSFKNLFDVVKQPYETLLLRGHSV